MRLSTYTHSTKELINRATLESRGGSKMAPLSYVAYNSCRVYSSDSAPSSDADEYLEMIG